jgi:hypothetical protein
VPCVEMDEQLVLHCHIIAYTASVFAK